MINLRWEGAPTTRYRSIPDTFWELESARRRLGSRQRRLFPARSSSSIQTPLIVDINHTAPRLLTSTLPSERAGSQSRLHTTPHDAGIMPSLIASPTQTVCHVPFPRTLSVLVLPGHATTKACGIPWSYCYQFYYAPTDAIFAI